MAFKHDRETCPACQKKDKFFGLIAQLRAQGAYEIVGAQIGLNVWNPKEQKFETECFHQVEYQNLMKKPHNPSWN